jgi:hypothetical protein
MNKFVSENNGCSLSNEKKDVLTTSLKNVTFGL